MLNFLDLCPNTNKRSKLSTPMFEETPLHVHTHIYTLP